MNVIAIVAATLGHPPRMTASMMQEVVAAAGKAKDQNPNENGTAVQDLHLVSTAKIGPEAIPRPTNTASTGMLGQMLTAVIVLTAAGPISIPIVARYCGG